MAVNIELCLFSFFLTLTSVYGGEFCFDQDLDVRWCSYGCCGYNNRNCCDANVALIVGLTVLAILVVSAIIAFVCCFMRRRGARGQVLNTSPAGNSAVVVSSGHNQTVTSMGQPMGQPMAYNTQAYQPGMYAPPPYPMGQQPPPPPMGYGAAMAPPPYMQATGQDNQAFKTPN